MTQNQIAYWNYVEAKRNHRAIEKETNRSNLARESETNRSNRAHEYQVFQQRMQDRDLKRIDQNELERSHRQSEWRDYWQLEETKRHNRAMEQANISSATANLMNAQTNVRAQQEVERANQVKERQNQQQITSVANLNQARVYQGYTANEITAAYQYGNLLETKRSNVANELLKSQQIGVEEFRNREIARHNMASEKEQRRHNLEQESISNTGNVINAVDLFRRFRRDDQDAVINAIRSVGSIAGGAAKIGGTL